MFDSMPGYIRQLHFLTGTQAALAAANINPMEVDSLWEAQKGNYIGWQEAKATHIAIMQALVIGELRAVTTLLRVPQRGSSTNHEEFINPDEITPEMVDLLSDATFRTDDVLSWLNKWNTSLRLQSCIATSPTVHSIETTETISTKDSSACSLSEKAELLSKIAGLEQELAMTKQELAAQLENQFESLSSGEAAVKLNPKTENKLHEAVAALASLYTKTDCSQPNAAAETIIQALELKGLGRLICRQALANYIKKGNQLLLAK